MGNGTRLKKVFTERLLFLQRAFLFSGFYIFPINVIKIIDFFR